MMNIEDALVVLDAALEDSCLNNLQELIFRQAWEGKTYSEIAEDCGYEANYIKNVGYKLWSLLSTVFAEAVTKSNFRTVIRRQYSTVLKNERSPHTAPDKSLDHQANFDLNTVNKLVENTNIFLESSLTNYHLNVINTARFPTTEIQSETHDLHVTPTVDTSPQRSASAKVLIHNSIESHLPERCRCCFAGALPLNKQHYDMRHCHRTVISFATNS